MGWWERGRERETEEMVQKVKVGGEGVQGVEEERPGESGFVSRSYIKYLCTFAWL